ncbi:MAG: squalene/phytoene synthase family protein [Hyphomonadaceae bacterium]|nr:squalene/phytoene synthase family protein [Hyphomonadaceae bacterium]
MSAVMNPSPALALDPQAHVEAVVARSGTSFGLGMRILGKQRREAMHAVYAFCREIDDIADEPAPLDQKRRELEGWRQEIEALYAGRPARPTARALAGPIERHSLAKQEFLLLIEGMEWDAEGPIIAPGLERLRGYCRRVAGAVGMLSMPIFGAPAGAASDRFALAMGEGLQLANITRDVAEDAAEGRLYLPLELLDAEGLPHDPAAVLAHPRLPEVRKALGARAREAFAAALCETQVLGWSKVRPALLMHAVYDLSLTALERQGFRHTAKPSISKSAKIFAALRAALIPPVEAR